MNFKLFTKKINRAQQKLENSLQYLTDTVDELKDNSDCQEELIKQLHDLLHENIHLTKKLYTRTLKEEDQLKKPDSQKSAQSVTIDSNNKK